MHACPARVTRWLLAAAATWALLQPAASAQEAVVISCPGPQSCTYGQGYAPTVLGKDSVRLVSPDAAGDAKRLRKGRSVRVASLTGFYRDPESGLVRVLDRNGRLGDVVVPSKIPSGAATAVEAVAEWSIEYRAQPKSKERMAVPGSQFVALLIGQQLQGAVVEFARHEAAAPRPHPARQPLIVGALAFTAGSKELAAWRDELKGSMRRSLEQFRAQRGDPVYLEATLAGGVEAMRIYGLVAPEGDKEEALQEELTSEYRRLLDRFAIAGALKSAGMHDAFLEKLDQIGLARWSRSDLMAGVGEAVRTSVQAHVSRARELAAAKQYLRALDEARLANRWPACDEEASGVYYDARVEFVSQNTVLATPEGERERSILQQIVRELQGIGPEVELTPERVAHMRKRIAEGERIDKDYLPLQLEKAKFLAKAGELTASREVVTQVERNFQLGRQAAEHWLELDASLNNDLLILRKRIERVVPEQFAAGQFQQALGEVAKALEAEPDNPRFLYLGAVAAAVLRDQARTRQYVERYLRLLVPDCTGTDEARTTLFDLYRRQLPGEREAPTGDRTPNWVSGQAYAPGEVFYDPVSGSFHPRVQVSVGMTGDTVPMTEFRWEGFMASSISTSVGNKIARSVKLELEPRYEQQHVYMSGIGTKANSAGQRRVMDLRYLNCPDFDPVLAARFGARTTTRGWAGNPFFHPFIWNDIFLFDLVYDDLGRITQAKPVAPDASRPGSPYSEVLTFTWDGNSTRLLAISGARYRREMKYDERGRLVSEAITHPDGRGRIEYSYDGDSTGIQGIECEDDFYDKGRRRIVLAGGQR